MWEDGLQLPAAEQPPPACWDTGGCRCLRWSGFSDAPACWPAEWAGSVRTDEKLHSDPAGGACNLPAAGDGNGFVKPEVDGL